MDPVKILKRSWVILWSYRALWVFGLILALAGAGSHGNSSMDFENHDSRPQNNQPLPEDTEEAFEDLRQEMQQFIEEGPSAIGLTDAEWNAIIAIAITFVVLCVLFSIALAVARYVSETAVIRMVDQYEASGT